MGERERLLQRQYGSREEVGKLEGKPRAEAQFCSCGDGASARPEASAPSIVLERIADRGREGFFCLVNRLLCNPWLMIIGGVRKVRRNDFESGYS